MRESRTRTAMRYHRWSREDVEQLDSAQTALIVEMGRLHRGDGFPAAAAHQPFDHPASPDAQRDAAARERPSCAPVKAYDTLHCAAREVRVEARGHEPCQPRHELGQREAHAVADKIVCVDTTAEPS